MEDPTNCVMTVDEVIVTVFVTVTKVETIDGVGLEEDAGVILVDTTSDVDELGD